MAKKDTSGRARRKHREAKRGFIGSESGPGNSLKAQLDNLAMAEGLVEKWGLRPLFAKLGIEPADLAALRQLLGKPDRTLAMWGAMISGRRRLADFLADPAAFIEKANADRVEDQKARALAAVDRKVKAAEAERQAVADLADGIGTAGDK